MCHIYFLPLISLIPAEQQPTLLRESTRFAGYSVFFHTKISLSSRFITCAIFISSADLADFRRTTIGSSARIHSICGIFFSSLLCVTLCFFAVQPVTSLKNQNTRSYPMPCLGLYQNHKIRVSFPSAP